MSSGFGKKSGPTIPTSGTTPFGYFPRPPSPTPSPPFPDSEFSAGPSARKFEAQAGARPHSSLGSNGPLKSSSQLHAAHIRAPFLHKGDKQSPVARDFGSQTPKRTLPSSPQDLATSISSKFPHFQNPGWSRSSPTQYNEDFLLDPGVDVVERAPFSQRGDMQNPATRDFGSNSQKRSFASTPQDLGTGMSSKFPQFQNSESSRSPPIQYNEDFLRDSGDDIMERNADTSSVIYDHVTSQRRKSPPSTAADLHSIVHHRPSWSNSQRPATFSEAWSVPGRPGSRSTSSQNEGSISPAETDNTRNLTEFSQVDEFQRNPYNHRDASKRPSISPPKSRIGMSGVRMPDSQHNPRLTPSADGTSDNSDITRPVNHSVSKRTRSSTPSAGQIIQMNSNSTEDDTDREEQAKAKRLARFKTELDVVESERGGSIPYGQNVTKGRVSSIKTDTSAAEKQNYSGDIPSGSMENQDLDNEDLQSSSAIVGLCKDMCPESERGERERKGDLDPYERLDGDRNQTNKILAVKKYNRTAEREPELIRPLPILQKTMDYLIQLLDQPYDERFLGLYNFMWDRMRAIRMDLRMQHIFNDRAITMLEQMIRLHIIAMHELCEFSKGEGFSEGFDAHLNIEQMNKTSVELFQLYDDHRKRGIFIPTEKEFRGYYALLKLDKHPGYKVDPAELSLDLAKMTAEIRQTLEVLMARDVARFCRIGNFIAFFRHARKASYHQACLMHAHFSKLRTKALASLHSGLQYNQGIPVAHIAKWLAMEGEEIESLLEYHGFSIKEFEEPYMVKEGPFLNDAKDYPTRRSTLVHRKKSSTIMEDVLSSHQLITSPSEPRKELRSDKHTAVQPIQSKSLLVSDGQMEIEAVSSSLCSVRDQPFPETSKSMQVQSELGMSKDGQPFTGTHHRVSTGSPRDNINTFASFQSHRLLEQPSPITPSPGSLVADAGQLMSYKDSPRSFPVQQSLSAVKSSYPGYLAGQQSFEGPVKFSSETAVHSELEPIQTALVSANNAKVTSPASEADASIISSLHEDVSMKEVPREEFDDVQRKVDIADNYDKEVAEAKLRLLLRIWRRRSLRKKHIREQNRVAANAALSSLTVGPPIWQYQDKLAPFRKLNIDEAMNKRYEKRQSSLTRWNVSDLVASKLAEKHEYSSCICWKVILFSWLQHGSCNVEAKSPVSHVSLDEWLHYKLIPAGKEEGEDDLIISAPGLSVWRKWASDQSGDYRGYFSVIKDTHPGVFEKELVGVNAILFPISETVPWDIQKIQLDNLVSSLPAGSCIPLLITSGFSEENFSQFSCSIIDKLGLRNLDKSRISSFMVVCLNEDHGQFDGYFSDQQLKEGLMWLASASPSQPALFCVTIRELISLHLNSCLDALDLIGDNVGPHQCISAFNQALDQSINNIVSAAEANPTGWPCPELYLLDDSTAEFRFIMKFLPALGWSSPEEVEPLIYALRNCKLPYFLDDISWLNSGCSSEMDIEDKKQLLQDCLIRYLTQSSSMLNLTMATKEARVMVQKYTRLELHDTEFKMVPSWVLIFRRVFNWQLNSSTSFSCKAYVLEESLTACSPLVLEKMEIEVPEPHYVVHPMLDEMVEVSCSPIVSKRVKSSPKSFQKVAAMAASDNTLGVISPDLLEEEQNQYSEIQVVDNPDFHVRKTDMLLAPEDDKKADRLSQLLDQCSTLQDDIEKRLSIYF